MEDVFGVPCSVCAQAWASPAVAAADGFVCPACDKQAGETANTHHEPFCECQECIPGDFVPPGPLVLDYEATVGEMLAEMTAPPRWTPAISRLLGLPHV